MLLCLVDLISPLTVLKACTERKENRIMKTKLTVMVATLVAISSLGLRGQEATVEQNMFEEEQVKLAAQQLKASQEAIAAAQKMLTPAGHKPAGIFISFLETQSSLLA